MLTLTVADRLSSNLVAAFRTSYFFFSFAWPSNTLAGKHDQAYDPVLQKLAM